MTTMSTVHDEPNPAILSVIRALESCCGGVLRKERGKDRHTYTFPLPPNRLVEFGSCSRCFLILSPLVSLIDESTVSTLQRQVTTPNGGKASGRCPFHQSEGRLRLTIPGAHATNQCGLHNRYSDHKLKMHGYSSGCIVDPSDIGLIIQFYSLKY